MKVRKNLEGALLAGPELELLYYLPPPPPPPQQPGLGHWAVGSAVSGKNSA